MIRRPDLPPPPAAARRPHLTTLHGRTLQDDWHWLRQLDEPEVLAHLTAENDWAGAWFAPLKPLVQRLFDEMLARIQEDDEDVPWRKNGWWYSTRTVKGRQYPVHLRRQGAPDGPEQVLLDMNVLAEGRPFLQVGAFDVSPDTHLLAYSLDETGALDFTLHVRDLRTGTDVVDPRSGAPLAIEFTADVAWGNDSRTLYYLTKDDAKRTHRLWRHTLGAGMADELLAEEPDETFWLGLSKTRDERWVLLQAASKDTSDFRVLDADDPRAAPREVLPRRTGLELSLDHRHGRFFLLVNDTGPNFRLVETDAMAPSLETAVEWIAHRPDVLLEDIDCFAGHLVISERARGVQQLVVHAFAGDQRHTIAFDEALYSASGDVNEEFDTTVFRFDYTSMVTPATVYDYDMTARTLTLRKRQPVLGGYDPSDYDACQVTATAPDGTAVPVSLVWRRDRRTPGTPQPLLLYGYGAYGIPMDVYFSSSRLSLLDRGVVFAMAHVRGGTDLGRTWYDDGKLGRKMNSFTDFVACAQALVDQGWTAPDRLIVEGGSAGGLLVGAAANLRPDLFRAVVAEVPFVDVLNTMLDETLPLTVGEFLEWGNPKVAADFATIAAYSPYDNLRAAAYPAVYLRTSLNDSQVPCWEAAKYAAKLRSLKTDDAPVVLSINMDAGHGGASGRYDALAERAEALAFMLDCWGLAG